MGWNYLSIPKHQRCNCWSLGMDKQIHPILCNGCSYLSMLGLKLNHVSKSGHRCSLQELLSWCPHSLVNSLQLNWRVGSSRRNIYKGTQSSNKLQWLEQIKETLVVLEMASNATGLISKVGLYPALFFPQELLSCAKNHHPVCHLQHH